MKNRLSLVLCLLLLINLLAGCWNWRELNTVAIVMGVGIDLTDEEKIMLTVQIARVDALKPETPIEEEAVWVVSSTGYTLFDAARNFTLESGRKLFWAHNQVIVISEAAAKHGVSQLVDFFDRDHEPRRTALVLISKDTTAQEIMKVKHPLERIPAISISQLVAAYETTGTSVQANLHQFLTMMTMPGRDPVATQIKLREQNREEEQDMQGSGMRVTGAAVFAGDRLRGWFDQEQTRGFNWVVGEIVSGIIVVQFPEEQGKNVAIEIIRASSDVVPEIIDQQLQLGIEIEMEGNLGDQLVKRNLAEPEMIAELEKRVVAVIESEISAAIRQAKYYGIDVFGFGDVVRRKFPSVWQELADNWHDQFVRLSVDIEVDAKISRTYLASAPNKPE